MTAGPYSNLVSLVHRHRVVTCIVQQGEVGGGGTGRCGIQGLGENSSSVFTDEPVLAAPVALFNSCSSCSKGPVAPGVYMSDHMMTSKEGRGDLCAAPHWWDCV